MSRYFCLLHEDTKCHAVTLLRCWMPEAQSTVNDVVRIRWTCSFAKNKWQLWILRCSCMMQRSLEMGIFESAARFTVVCQSYCRYRGLFLLVCWLSTLHRRHTTDLVLNLLTMLDLGTLKSLPLVDLDLLPILFWSAILASHYPLVCGSPKGSSEPGWINPGMDRSDLM